MLDQMDLFQGEDVDFDNSLSKLDLYQYTNHYGLRCLTSYNLELELDEVRDGFVLELELF